MCVYIHAAAHSGQKKISNPLELELPYTGAGKLNSDPIEEKQVPINTEPSVRPLKVSERIMAIYLSYASLILQLKCS